MRLPVIGALHHEVTRRGGLALGSALALSVALGFVAAPAFGAGPASSSTQPAREQSPAGVVAAFIEAQGRLDTARMTALMADDYVEISPLGAIDARRDVIGFFSDPAVRPYMVKLSVEQEREWPGTALVIATLASEVEGKQRLLRTTYFLRRSAGSWLIAAVQYTAVRTPG